MGQIICECGRVAELRRRSNGKKLPFRSCKACGPWLGKEEVRAKWLEAEKPDGALGVYGEFPAGASQEAVEKPEAQGKANSEYWEPDSELQEPETPAKKQAGSGSKAFIGKCIFGLFVFGAAAFGISKLPSAGNA